MTDRIVLTRHAVDRFGRAMTCPRCLRRRLTIAAVYAAVLFLGALMGAACGSQR